ncbi:MAG TPA: aromatic ring-hydroxylating dioxygenase subunit alpha [Sphingopyxis sp.]|nr:aromatic ring-hydroxylating dioxygenase subunit alpha [Sphingopyxis sp.]HMP43689.1 aromatic ring-hydroxylating dioxygenase subunit alpha [Sphingopyxis sp.]HMQ17651.1 aromatic ring-hydroxylating dioxygenase subunit alpha [Sphingopyxis sp.]
MKDDVSAAPYLLDCWYVAAWASELRPGEHRKRVLLDRPVLLMRGAKGGVAAIGNVCPHRFASLSEGRFEDDLVECPYHGLRFDMEGRCVHNPHGDGRIAERARVADYPLVERHGALWIWPGDRAAADPARIPDLSLLETASPDDRAPGHLLTKANYQLLSDNILDLSHADFIHPATLGTGGEIARAGARARLHGDIVTVEWAFTGKGMAMERPLRDGAEVNSRFEVTWYPAGVMILRNEIGPVGDGGPGAARAGVHIMTPETARTTHYFFENADAGRRQKLALALDVFEREDGVMLEEVQRNMGDRDFWDLEPLVLSNDSGAILARRVLQRLIRGERAHSADGRRV